MEGRKWMEGNLDRILKMLLFGRKERKKGRKCGRKKYMWGPLFFYPSKIGRKTLFHSF